MTIEQLRLTHPRFIYKQYSIDRGTHEYTITFDYLLEPSIPFRSVVTIPHRDHSVDMDELRRWAFSLGLVEMLSYWKCACSREIIIEAGSCSDEQLRFWRDLLLHGLGEFFYQNSIDFTEQNFVTIRSAGSAPPFTFRATEVHDTSADLVLTSGGKDTAVTLGILKRADRTIQTMILNPTQAALDLVRSAGYINPIVITRRLDPTLYELNAKGYLNGHTPFSSYLAFLGSLVAALYEFDSVIVSNEQSANEGNVVYRGMEINHQYSKSYRFEQMFRTYATTILGARSNYFSFLRPLNDLQIAKLFARFPEFFTVFRSCNVASRENLWCGLCAKCAFTYLVLSPFIAHEQLIACFGGDLFQSQPIIEHIRAEVGLTPVKPFECVGTRDEARLALFLAIDRYATEGREIPEALLTVKSDLAISEDSYFQLKSRLLDTWADTYNLPDEYLSLLRFEWEKDTQAL